MQTPNIKEITRGARSMIRFSGSLLLRSKPKTNQTELSMDKSNRAKAKI